MEIDLEKNLLPKNARIFTVTIRDEGTGEVLSEHKGLHAAIVFDLRVDNEREKLQHGKAAIGTTGDIAWLITMLPSLVADMAVQNKALQAKLRQAIEYIDEHKNCPEYGECIHAK